VNGCYALPFFSFVLCFFGWFGLDLLWACAPGIVILFFLFPRDMIDTKIPLPFFTHAFAVF